MRRAYLGALAVALAMGIGGSIAPSEARCGLRVPPARPRRNEFNDYDIHKLGAKTRARMEKARAEIKEPSNG